VTGSKDSNKELSYISLTCPFNICQVFPLHLHRCPTAADAAAVSIAQMTFLATSLNILSIVININNNINNNNNNKNKLNINAQSNNNVVTNTNVNNGNQINVMVPILNP